MLTHIPPPLQLIARSATLKKGDPAFPCINCGTIYTSFEGKQTAKPKKGSAQARKGGVRCLCHAARISKLDVEERCDECALCKAKKDKLATEQQFVCECPICNSVSNQKAHPKTFVVDVKAPPVRGRQSVAYAAAAEAQAKEEERKKTEAKIRATASSTPEAECMLALHRAADAPSSQDALIALATLTSAEDMDDGSTNTELKQQLLRKINEKQKTKATGKAKREYNNSARGAVSSSAAARAVQDRTGQAPVRINAIRPTPEQEQQLRLAHDMTGQQNDPSVATQITNLKKRALAEIEKDYDEKTLLEKKKKMILQTMNSAMRAEVEDVANGGSDAVLSRHAVHTVLDSFKCNPRDAVNALHAASGAALDTDIFSQEQMSEGEMEET